MRPDTSYLALAQPRQLNSTLALSLLAELLVVLEDGPMVSVPPVALLAEDQVSSMQLSTSLLLGLILLVVCIHTSHVLLNVLKETETKLYFL